MDIFTSTKFSHLYKKLKDQPRITQIKRYDFPTKAIFSQEIAQAGYPVVFSFPNRLDISSNQVFDLLANKYGHTVLKVRVGDYANPNIYTSSRQYVSVELREFIAGMTSKDTDQAYAGNQVLSQEIAEELNVTAPPFYPRDDFEAPAIWLGGKGTVTPLHKDSADNFAFHVCGRKRWILFPVRDAEYLYLSRAMDKPDSDFAASDIDLRNPDFTKFPALKNAKSIEVTINTGEVLYLPAGWSHFVENIEKTLMINYWLSIKKRSPAVLE